MEILTKRELEELTTIWGNDRQIITNGKVPTQTLKFGEELAELFEAKSEAQRFDAIGDMAVVLTMVAGINGVNILDCEKRAMIECPNNLLSPRDLLVSMYGMLCSAVVREQYDKVNHLIGFMITILNDIAMTNGTTIEHCWTLAYNEIKDRKGRLLANGNFVKDE